MKLPRILPNETSCFCSAKGSYVFDFVQTRFSIGGQRSTIGFHCKATTHWPQPVQCRRAVQLKAFTCTVLLVAGFKHQELPPFVHVLWMVFSICMVHAADSNCFFVMLCRFTIAVKFGFHYENLSTTGGVSATLHGHCWLQRDWIQPRWQMWTLDKGIWASYAAEWNSTCFGPASTMIIYMYSIYTYYTWRKGG